MNLTKRYLGLLWMLLAPVLLYLLFSGAIKNIDLSGSKDINKPVPWIIILAVFTPIAIGLAVFGWYAWKGDYDQPQDSASDINGR